MKGTVDYGKATLLALGAGAVFFVLGGGLFYVMSGLFSGILAFILVYALLCLCGELHCIHCGMEEIYGELKRINDFKQAEQDGAEESKDARIKQMCMYILNIMYVARYEENRDFYEQFEMRLEHLKELLESGI